MKISEQIVNKVQLGEKLTDRELDQAVEFYNNLAESLNCLGPVYKLAWRAIWEEANRLRGFRDARLAQKTTNQIDLDIKAKKGYYV